LIKRRDSVSRQIYFLFIHLLKFFQRTVWEEMNAYKDSGDRNQATHSDSVMCEGRMLSDAKTRHRRASMTRVDGYNRTRSQTRCTYTRLAFAERTVVRIIFAI